MGLETTAAAELPKSEITPPASDSVDSLCLWSDYTFVIVSLSLSLFGITTRLLYMLIEHLLLNIIVTFYIPGQL